MEIDNNLVENAIRPTALGKKNWLFVGEAQAGERGAILYTLIGNGSVPSIVVFYHFIVMFHAKASLAGG